SSMLCLSLRAVRAPGRPRAISCWMRVSRTLTRENSAATEELVARMKKATMITRKSIHSSIDDKCNGNANEIDAESSGREPFQHRVCTTEPWPLATALIARHRWPFIKDLLNPSARFGVTAFGHQQTF